MLIYMNIHMNLWLTILTRLLTLTARHTKDPGLAARLWEAANDLKPRG